MCNPFRYFVAFLLISSLNVVQIKGQEANWRFQRYSIQEGLSQGTVRTILQDRKGFWWFGTADGLNRYDGYEFNTYHHHGEEKGTITSGDVLKLYEDKNGDIWALTDAGCSRYNHISNNFTTFPYREKPINIFYEDNESQLWMTTFSNHIQIVNRTTGEANHFYKNPYSESERPNIASYLFHKNIFYQFFPKFICSFNIKTKQWSKIEKNEQFGTVTSAQIIDNRVVLGNNTGTMFVCDEYFNIYHRNKICIGEINNIIKFKGNWLIATNEGLGVFDPIDEKLQIIKSDENDPKSLSINLVTCLATDKNNSLWIGTNTGGLNRLILRENKFNCISVKDYYLIKSIYKRPNSKYLYCSVFKKGLDIFDLEQPQLPPKVISRKTDIFKIEPWDDSHLLLFYSKGVLLFNQLNNQLTDVNTNLFNNDSKAVIKAVCQYTKNRFLVAINKKIYYYENLYDFQPFSEKAFDNEITTLYTENGKDLMVGTSNGLFQYSTQKGSKKIIDKVYVKHILKTNEGSFWIATTTGLYQIDNIGNIKLFNSDKYGLANDFIYGIVEGAGNAIWVSHNKGLSRLNVSKSVFKNFSQSYNLQSYEFNTGAFFHSTDSLIFFGGVQGINYFNANSFFDNPIAPIPIITKIRINEEDTHLDTIIWYKKAILLPHNQNTLSFEFSGLQYDNANNNQYYYKMEGIDKNWIFAGGKRFARYPNLLPGKYIFKVRATNEDGNESEQIATFAIEITAPIFMRPWFLLLIGIIGLGSIMGGIYYLQRRKIRKQEQALLVITKVKNERERISRELHDNIGAQVTYLITSMDWVSKQLPEGSDTVKERLTTLKHNAQNMMSSLRDTIWTLNKEEITIQDFADRLKQYIIYQIRDNSNIELSYFQHIEIEHILSSDIILNLFRIGQEAVQNIIKHSQAHVITLSIICEKNDELLVAIGDDGKGFDVSQNKDDSFGLDNMNYRALEIGGEFTIKSAPNKGTVIELRIKL